MTNKDIEDMKNKIDELVENLKIAEDKNYCLTKENERLQSEVDKYCKAFDNAKKERDRQTCEYQKKIEELTEKMEFINKNSISLHQEPICIAKDLIEATGEYEQNQFAKAFCGTDKGIYKIFDVTELRQIAEHLLVYCNNNRESYDG